MEGEKGTVCVTRGTEYIASWLIKRLLEEGYSVHTTIRVDPAIEGSKGVLHVAASMPMDFENNEPEAVLTTRAIDGALGILR
ncbi:hypothetical protein CRYUN_Cryun01aG0242000 [Craigia yunnanensis]